MRAYRDGQRQPLSTVAVFDASAGCLYVLMECLSCRFFICWFRGLAEDFCCYGYGFRSFTATPIVMPPSSHYVCNFRFCIFMYLYCVFHELLILYICTHTRVCVCTFVFDAGRCSHLCTLLGEALGTLAKSFTSSFPLYPQVLLLTLLLCHS